MGHLPPGARPAGTAAAAVPVPPGPAADGDRPRGQCAACRPHEPFPRHGRPDRRHAPARPGGRVRPRQAAGGPARPADGAAPLSLAAALTGRPAPSWEPPRARRPSPHAGRHRLPRRLPRSRAGPLRGEHRGGARLGRSPDVLPRRAARTVPWPTGSPSRSPSPAAHSQRRSMRAPRPRTRHARVRDVPPTRAYGTVPPPRAYGATPRTRAGRTPLPTPVVAARPGCGPPR